MNALALREALSLTSLSWDELPDLLAGGDGEADRRRHYRTLDYRESGGALRRFVAPSVHGDWSRAELRPGHPALTEARTRYPGTVVHPDRSPRVLVSGQHNSKIGGRVTRGKWAGCPIFTLTLEERATCPPSCSLWAACFGNAMHLARRHQAGPALEAAIARELAAMQTAHPRGFAVRVHVLGDFYSLSYAERWLEWIEAFPALRVWGYTAWPSGSPIGRAVQSGNDRFPDRWAFRFSVAQEAALLASGAPNLATTIWRKPEADVVPEGIICPSERRGVKCCGSCGLCWADGARGKAIAFVGHGRGGRGKGERPGAIARAARPTAAPVRNRKQPGQGAARVSNRGGEIWTDAMIQQLRMLWDKGIATAEIGRRMGLSKNSIVGKAHRLELPPRPSPIEREKTDRVPRRQIPKRAKGPTLPPLYAPPLTPAATVICAPAGAAEPAVRGAPPPPLADMPGFLLPEMPHVVERPDGFRPTAAPARAAGRGVGRECVWPIGTPGRAGFRFCCDPAESGKSYCADHCAVAYVKRARPAEELAA